MPRNSAKLDLSEKEIKLLQMIRDSRIAKNITQAEISKKTNLSQSYIAHLENMKRIPSEPTIKKISDALGDRNILEFYKSNLILKQGKSYDKVVAIDSLPIDKESLDKYIALQKITIYLPNETKELLNKYPQKDFYAYRMNDESMEPTIKKGDYLIIQFLDIDLNTKIYKYYDFYYKQLNESFVAVYDGKSERHIRKLYIMSSPEYYNEETPLYALEAHNLDFYTYLIEKPKITKGNGNELYTYTRYKTDKASKKYYDMLEIVGKLKVIGKVIAIIRENIIGSIFGGIPY